MEKCPTCGSLNDPFDTTCYKCKTPRGGVAVKADPGRAHPAPIARPTHAPPPPPPAPVARCEACRQPLAGSHSALRTCLHCGWDNDRHMRRCQHCSGPVIFYDAELGEKKGGGVGAGLGAGGVLTAFGSNYIGRRLGYHLGVPYSLAAGFGVVAVAALYKAVFTTFHCAMCHREPALELLSEKERKALARFKANWWAVTIGSAIATIGFGIAGMSGY